MSTVIKKQNRGKAMWRHKTTTCKSRRGTNTANNWSLSQVSTIWKKTICCSKKKNKKKEKIIYIKI